MLFFSRMGEDRRDERKPFAARNNPRTADDYRCDYLLDSGLWTEGRMMSGVFASVSRACSMSYNRLRRSRIGREVIQSISSCRISFRRSVTRSEKISTQCRGGPREVTGSAGSPSMCRLLNLLKLTAMFQKAACSRRARQNSRSRPCRGEWVQGLFRTA